VTTAALRAVGIGAGGHAAVVLEILKLAGACEVVGLLDVRPELWGTSVDGVAVLGDDLLLPSLYSDGVRGAFLGLGSVGDTRHRRALYALALRHGFEMVAAIHPAAVVSSAARIGGGVTVMSGACINPGAVLGCNVLINTGAIVEHHCAIGDHVHIASGARLAGGVTVGDCSHVGLGACVLQNVRLGRSVVVGAGAVVIEDVEDGAVVVGVPAKPLSERQRR
jgi:sugar O-acyltransferase (sialic acid O-acetyltransferase NeuD family)